MKNVFILVMYLVSILYAQHAPVAEPVYGGYVEKIAAISSGSSTLVYVATRSENSLFYTTISSGVFSTFDVVPDFSDTENMGYISLLAADENSGFAFVATEESGLWGVGTTSGSRYSVDSDFIEALEVYSGELFYIKYSGSYMDLYYTTISSSGAVATINNIRVASATSPRFGMKIIVNPSNEYLYIFVPGVSPTFYKSSDIYSSINSSTTFSAITTTDLASSGLDFVTAGIAPDGRIYAMSYEGNTAGYSTNVAYSDDDGDPWILASISSDAGRGDISIVGDTSNYMIYYSRIVSDDKGASWIWTTHADGAIAGDEQDINLAYVRTDWGFGIYDHSSTSTTEANTGLSAVEVKALGMNVGKSIAWVAAKSGIYYVSGYDTSSPTWSSPIWPQGDSYPYSVAICDQTGDLAYLGNTGGKLYRYYISNGSQTDIGSYDLIFDAEDDSPYPDWSWTYGTKISAVAIDHTTPSERIFVGLFDEEDWDESGDHLGALFMGENSGGTWTWTQITSTVFPNGIDIFDVIAVSEGGNTVLYVGVKYSGGTNGVYRIEETSSGTWSATQDLYLSASYPISAYITDIAKSPTDTLYLCGTDVSISNPVIYKKAIGDTYWTVIPSYGFSGDERIAWSVTFDNVSTTYIAVDNKIFEHAAGASSWSLYYEYPLGTEINFIYYDDLLVGTGTGLYMHPANPTDVKEELHLPDKYALYQNYPNPFNPSTVIKYSIPVLNAYYASNVSNVSTTNVTLKVYDILGREVATLVNKEQAPGNYEATFNTKNITSGIYFYKLQSSNFVETKKMMLLK